MCRSTTEFNNFYEHVNLWGLSFVKIGRDVWNMPPRLEASTMPSTAYSELPTVPPTGSSARGRMPRRWPSTRSLGPPSTAARFAPRRHRGTVVLRYFADLSESQTALALGVSTGSVKQHTSRAMASLKRELGEP